MIIYYAKVIIEYTENWLIKLFGGFTKKEYERMAMIVLDRDLEQIPEVSVLRADGESMGIFK